MDVFLQSTALVLVAVILLLVLRQNKETGTLLSLAVCAIVCIAVTSMLSPVLDFLGEIRRLGNLDKGFLTILLKCAGIGFISELAALICSDAGEGALAKAVQLLANAAVLLLSLPLLRQMLTILEEVLGEL